MILGIESSCDDTSAAIFDGKNILANVVNTQEIHKKYGGVVPEIASREHLLKIEPVVREALNKAGLEYKDLTQICVTKGPGLSGSLLIGVTFAKALAMSLNIPIYGVNHIEAHLWATALEYENVEPPFISLIISGGHTQLWYVEGVGKYTLLGQTIDDAVGEAFDKTAKMLGLPYPGGPFIDKLSSEGNPKFHTFPRPLMNKEGFDFSFSGLKTSVLYYLRGMEESEMEKNKADIAASVQQALIDVLIKKTLKAADKYKASTIVLGGGVAANKGLKQQLTEATLKQKMKVFIPSLQYCTDNAAMIAYLGHLMITKGVEQDGMKFSADPSLKIKKY